MQTIQVQQNGDVYSCNIGISQKEWLEILLDENTPQTYKETVLRFFYYPAHRGSCTAVSNAMGGNAQKLNANIRELGKYVQKRLERFQVIRPDGTPCFWIIPMNEGKELSKESVGTFEWELRSELVEAVKDYLYRYLIERYKELRKNIPINGAYWTELYKWQLITVNKGKTPIDIIRDHVANPKKSELGGFENLIDAARDNKSLKYLMDNKPAELEMALNKLADESQPLNKRLSDYKSTMAGMLPLEGYNSKANDERTASVILTCINPWKYTIYKYDVYTNLCKYFGEEIRPTGQCYKHFLELVTPLCKLISHDETFQQIVSTSLEGQEKCDLLLAQDILWMLFVTFPDQLEYIRQIMFPNKQRVWLWSKSFLSESQDVLEIGSSAKTIKDFRPYKSKNALRKAYQQDVGNGDLKIPDAYWAFINEVNVGDIVVVFEPKKGNGKQYHLLHGWGVITSDCVLNEAKENPMSREVQWRDFLQIPKQNEEMGNSQFFQGTTDKQALHIKELLNINTQETMESKYQKYIDLLKANKNLILTGAPGTGKTYMAKAIAEEMGAEVGFVQFHPSYDYTDFVEGLRPINDDNGNVGFERRDGVFKEFCKEAFKNIENSQKSQKELTAEHTLEEKYNEFVDKIENGDIQEISLKTEGKTMDVLRVSDNNNIILRTSGKTDGREYTVSFERLTKLAKVYPNAKSLNTITNIHNAVTAAIRGCHSSSYWAVLNAVYQQGISETIVIPTEIKQKPFVFIIDEINRGEISKIFGELFFSIDPGYRGEKGKVNTQYQNMIEAGDVFKDGFYVPENVYLIGTMNDIDRNVESMDFAMRRRFAWQEVTAEESYANMIESDADFALVKDEIKTRMFNLNKAISETEGLDDAYQIGAAYFRKYLDYQDSVNPFECLWENHLKGLLFEYLRGNRRAKVLLEILHDAYNKTSIDEKPAH